MYLQALLSEYSGQVHRSGTGWVNICKLYIEMKKQPFVSRIGSVGGLLGCREPLHDSFCSVSSHEMLSGAEKRDKHGK